MADTLNDLLYKYYSSVVTGSSSMSGAINVSRAAVGIEATTSTMADGKVNAPAAGAVIAQTADLSAGTYEIDVTAYVGGTVADLDTDNMKFYIGNTPIMTLIAPAGKQQAKQRVRVNIGGPAPMVIKATAAATAASIYYGNVICSKIGY